MDKISGSAEDFRRSSPGEDPTLSDLSGELSIGRMAELNCVSERTLRFYNVKGLLVPGSIDPYTGYRHYTLSQCATLDMIQQMKELGFSLGEIKEILDKRDVDYLAEHLESRTAEIDEEISNLRISQQIGRTLLNNCSAMQGIVKDESIIYQQLPERHILRTGIPNTGMTQLLDNGSKAVEEWELTLRLVKRVFVERGYPLSLFRNVGCTIDRERLEEHDLRFNDTFVIVNESYGEYYEDAEIVPAGLFATSYCSGLIAEDGSYNELNRLRIMLNDIAEKGYSICGDYMGEVIAETPVFCDQRRDMSFQLQIPVDKRC